MESIVTMQYNWKNGVGFSSGGGRGSSPASQVDPTPASTVRHAVLSINGVDVNGKYTVDGKEVLEYLGNPGKYPVSIHFSRPPLTSNEKLMLASMFHLLFAISSQLSSKLGRSGIEMLETDTFKFHVFQTLTSIRFMPIRCDLFDQHLKLALEVADKAGIFGPSSKDQSLKWTQLFY
ncbi:trafficking protein particle complex subunit 4-like [Trichosurus vulpecula]|uniref:trafficking protein particle complex subunit 4-like n=1 Tax=Trichosurus vulpecula TaxID=9337 RepID=UPI00186B53E5|nr:trafficking protein particle complex subunit 4-like [Trichosurus vulpecula]